jgi:glycosyltransferase involved in cell wall biosynthesis
MLKTTVIIPCFNEARRLPLDDFKRSMPGMPGISFCFVNDGSADGTGDMLESLRSLRREQVSVVSLERNCGKSEAVRRGVLRALEDKEVECVAFMDADLSTPLTEVDLLVGQLEKNPELTMVFGSRFKRLGASILRKPRRHVMGRVFATVVSLMLRLPIYDTQCGAKAFRALLARDVFRDPFITRWLFDVEIFGRIAGLYDKQEIYRRLLEVPLNAWHDIGGSKMKFFNFLSVPFDLLRIKLRIRPPR